MDLTLDIRKKLFCKVNTVQQVWEKIKSLVLIPLSCRWSLLSSDHNIRAKWPLWYFNIYYDYYFLSELQQENDKNIIHRDKINMRMDLWSAYASYIGVKIYSIYSGRKDLLKDCWRSKIFLWHYLVDILFH